MKTSVRRIEEPLTIAPSPSHRKIYAHESGRIRQAAAVIATHWVSALLVVVAALSALARELTENSHLRNLLIDSHRQIGLLVLLALGLRLALRVRVGLKDSAGDMALPLRIAAHAAHLLLYALLLAIPLLGWAVSNAHGLTLHLFGVVPLPLLVEEDPDLADSLTDKHILASWILLAAVTAHVLAALWHHLVRRDQVLSAMLPDTPARERTRLGPQLGAFTARWSGKPRRAR